MISAHTAPAGPRVGQALGRPALGSGRATFRLGLPHGAGHGFGMNFWKSLNELSVPPPFVG